MDQGIPCTVQQRLFDEKPLRTQKFVLEDPAKNPKLSSLHGFGFC